ncbi:MAG: DUF2070 family protein [Candidatus Bathyarchaeia archaeon]
MVSRNSIDGYIGGAVQRYSALFGLPSQGKIVLLLFALCMLGGVLAIVPVCPSYDGFALGLMFGAIFLLIMTSTDFLVSRSSMRADPVFDFRRCAALSLFSSILWFGLIFVGNIVNLFLRNPAIWIKFSLLGFYAVFMLRLIVFSSISLADRVRIFLSSLFQPALCVILAFAMAPLIQFRLTYSLILYMPLSISVVGLAVHLFVFLIDRAGKKGVGIPSLSLFKAFMVNWTEDLNMPLENFFESLGSVRDVGLSMLAFRGNEDMKALIVVPAFHAGPFKNVGSSLFPSMAQEALEDRLACVVSVPHGLFGHSLDLSSQAQSRKVINSVLESLDFAFSDSKATPLMRARENGASASCQIFGNCAFVTLTLAPETMEDLPEELNLAIVSKAEGQGLSSAIVIDAHNSIDGLFNLEKALNPLRRAAVTSIEEALSCQRLPFRVGASRIVPKEFEVKDGMGPGGISVVVTEVGGQRAAYVVFDGNNMISGLREKIFSTLHAMGVADGEVLTTDTHAVNGVVPTPRGYHPIGDVMDHSKIIEYVKEVVTKALESLEPARVSWRREIIQNIRVIGEEQIKALCTLTDNAAKRAKAAAVTLFPIAGVFLAVVLAFA